MQKFTFFFVLFFIQSLFGLSQNLPEDMPKIFYRNEKTIAVNLNSNGWGLGYRYGSRINVFEKRIYELDFSIIKHSKEISSSNSSIFSSESFVFGKQNNIFDLRFGYGKQNELFRKPDAGAVAIRYFYSVGPSVVIQKPIYYEILYRLNDSTYTIKEEKFNPTIHTSDDINGKSSFFKGFDEIKLIPGLFFKTGFNFEFSQKETTVHAIEAGILLQAYLKNLDIMAVDDNQQYFFTLFVCYRIGKITNAQQISPDYLRRHKKKINLFNWL